MKQQRNITHELHEVKHEMHELNLLDRSSDSNPTELNKLDTPSNSRWIEMTMDSGAGDTVTSESVIPEVNTVTPHGPDRGTTYILPGGDVIRNKGEKHVPITTKEGPHAWCACK